MWISLIMILKLKRKLRERKAKSPTLLIIIVERILTKSISQSKPKTYQKTHDKVKYMWGLTLEIN